MGSEDCDCRSDCQWVDSDLSNGVGRFDRSIDEEKEAERCALRFKGGAGDYRWRFFDFRNDSVNSVPIRGPRGWSVLRIAIDSVESNDRYY